MIKQKASIESDHNQEQAKGKSGEQGCHLMVLFLLSLHP